jgi:glutathione synthase/RimK-type ligase-like ATP-grasp enzyme
MYNLKLLPYKGASQSAKDLAQLLNVMRVKPDGNYVPKVGHTVVSWGYSGTPAWIGRAQARGVRILNKPGSVNVAANKLSALNALSTAGVSVPEFTTDANVARRWVNSGGTVVERHELRGNSGAGIRIVNLDDDSMPSIVHPAPLYTKFIPKTAEFRVHVFNGQVIDYIEKKRQLAENRGENFNKYVSSIHQGWVFSRTNIRDIPEVRELAVRAVRALGLDFGAVDIIYHEGRAFVLEVNTSPGLSGVTLVKYANAFRRYMGQADLTGPAVDQLLNREVQTPPPPAAAVQAQVNVVNGDGDLVEFKMSRRTALELKRLLAAIN